MSDIFMDEKEVSQIRQPRVQNNELQNTANYTKITYSSSGRFWIPPELHFRELNTKEVADLSSSNVENLLENLIVILNSCVLEQIDVGDMTPEEFLETLIAMKLDYTHEHDHFFICEECSAEDQELNEVKPSTFKVDLTTFNYTDIEDSDIKLREFYKPLLESFTPEEFKDYLLKRYKDNPIENIENHTIEKELESIEVKREYSFTFEGKQYKFRWLKISDMAVAQKKIDEKYKPKIKKIIKEKYPNVPVAEQKLMKKEKIDKIKENQHKDISYLTLSMTLEFIDGKPLNLAEKQKEYLFPQSTANSIAEYLKTCEFGLTDERDIVCDKCGHVQRRSLQHTITFIELLPLNTATKRKSADNKRNVIFVGV